MIYTVEVSAGGPAVTGVEERLTPAESLYSLAHVPFLGEHVVSDVYLDPAYGGYDLLEPFEIRDNVAVYLDAREPFYHLSGLLDAAIRVGGVDPVLHPRLDLDIEVARDGEELDVSGRRGYLREHDRIGVARRSLGRTRSPVYSENEDLECFRGDFRRWFVRRLACRLAVLGRLRCRRREGLLRLVRGVYVPYVSHGIGCSGTIIVPGENPRIGSDAKEEADQDHTDQERPLAVACTPLSVVLLTSLRL